MAVGTFGLELRHGRVCEVRHPGAQVDRLCRVLLDPVECSASMKSSIQSSNILLPTNIDPAHAMPAEIVGTRNTLRRSPTRVRPIERFESAATTIPWWLNTVTMSVMHSEFCSMRRGGSALSAVRRQAAGDRFGRLDVLCWDYRIGKRLSENDFVV